MSYIDTAGKNHELCQGRIWHYIASTRQHLVLRSIGTLALASTARWVLYKNSMPFCFNLNKLILRGRFTNPQTSVIIWPNSRFTSLRTEEKRIKTACCAVSNSQPAQCWHRSALPRASNVHRSGRWTGLAPQCCWSALPRKPTPQSIWKWVRGITRVWV